MRGRFSGHLIDDSWCFCINEHNRFSGRRSAERDRRRPTGGRVSAAGGEGRPAGSWEGGRLTAVLELTNISKHFGAIQAVNDVSFTLEAGQVVGLMGDNGAGKSKLVKMIAGNFRPSEGTM
ncbi:ATP-binding cassette domain-containing protein, partial [Rhizobium phaseoli]